MKNILLTLAIMLFSHVCMSQPYNVNSVELDKSTSRGALYEGIDDEGFIYASSYRFYNFVLFSIVKNWIKVINPETGEITVEKNIERLVSKRGYRYVDFVVLGNKPIVVVTKKGTIRDDNYYAFGVDRSLRLLKDAYKIGKKPTCVGFGKGVGQEFEKGVLMGVNEINRTTTFVSDLSCSKEDVKKLLVVTLNENSNVIYDYTFKIDLKGILSKQKIFTYNDKLYFYVLQTTREHVSGQLFNRDVNTPHLYAINMYGEVTEVNLKMDEDYIASEIGLVEAAGKVLVTGQIVEKGTSKLRGVFTAEMNTVDKTLERVEKQLFDDAFITKFWSDKEIDRAERRNNQPVLNANFVLADQFNTDDDGAIYLFQKREVERVSRGSSTSLGAYTASIYYYYYYTDLIVCKVNANAEISWVELLPLYQLTIDHDIGPSFVATQKQGVLYLIHAASKEQIDKINAGEYHNERTQFKDRFQNKTAITRIDTEGRVSSEAVIDQSESRVNFSPATVANNKKQHKFMLLDQKRKLFGNGKYITINSISY